MSDTQLASRKDIREFLLSDTVKSQVALALPKFLTPERMLRICVTSINRNPKLAECTTESLLSAIMQASQMGIECDGRHGHLIPRWSGKKQCNEATFQPDYKGLVALIRRSPEVADIYADVVCENDVFQIRKGLHRDLVHEIDIRADRGAIIGAYAVIQYRGGVSGFEFMSRKEIETQHRDRSESWKAHVSKGYDTPWKTDEGEMFKKTAIIRVSKLADLSPEVYDRMPETAETVLGPDRVTEIPRAQIPQSTPAQLEENTGTAETSNVQRSTSNASIPEGGEKTVAATVIEPPASGKGTPRKKKLPAVAKKEEKPTGAPAAAAPTPATEEPIIGNPAREKLRQLLKESGYTPEQLFAVAANNKWLHDGERDFSDFSDELVTSFVDDWGTALQLMKELHGEPTPKSDSPFV